jgi:hypothetical protein
MTDEIIPSRQRHQHQAFNEILSVRLSETLNPAVTTHTQRCKHWLLTDAVVCTRHELRHAVKQVFSLPAPPPVRIANGEALTVESGNYPRNHARAKGVGLAVRYGFCCVALRQSQHRERVGTGQRSSTKTSARI